MGYFDTKQLKEEIGELHATIEQIKKTPVDEGRPFNDEEFAKFDATVAELKTKQSQLESAVRVETISETAAPRPWLGETAKTVPYTRQSISQKADPKDINQAAKALLYAMSNRRDLITPVMMNAVEKTGCNLNVIKVQEDYTEQLTNPQNAVNTHLITAITAARADANEMRKCCTVWNTTDGGNYPLLSYDDTAVKGAKVNRVGGGHTSVGFELVLKYLSAYKTSTGCFPIPYAYIKDFAFDTVGEIRKMSGERLARSESDLIVNGSGISTCKGLKAWVAATEFYPKSTSAFEVAYDDVILALKGKVPFAYSSNNAGLCMSPTTLNNALRQRDTLGHFVNKLTEDADGTKRLNNDRVWLVPELDAGEIYYSADWSLAVIRTTGTDFHQLNETFLVEYDSLGFCANSSVDFGIKDVRAFAAAAPAESDSFITCGNLILKS